LRHGKRHVMGMSQKLQFLRQSFVYWHGFQACGVKPNFPESPFSRVYTNNPIIDQYDAEVSFRPLLPS
jgi:hypothetical protein